MAARDRGRMLGAEEINKLASAAVAYVGDSTHQASAVVGASAQHSLLWRHHPAAVFDRASNLVRFSVPALAHMDPVDAGFALLRATLESRVAPGYETEVPGAVAAAVACLCTCDLLTRVFGPAYFLDERRRDPLPDSAQCAALAKLIHWRADLAGLTPADAARSLLTNANLHLDEALCRALADASREHAARIRWKLETELAGLKRAAVLCHTSTQRLELGTSLAERIAAHLGGSTGALVPSTGSETRTSPSDVPPPTPVPPPRGILELTQRAARIAAGLTGGRSYVAHTYVGIPTSLGGSHGHIRAYFEFHTDTGMGTISLRAAEADFIQGALTNRLPAVSTEAERLGQLLALRNAVEAMFHENLHAIGPEDQTVAAAAFTEAFAGSRYFSEGLVELAAQHYLGRFLAQSGLVAKFPRLGDLSPSKDLYRAEVLTMEQVVSLASKRSGAPAGHVLNTMLVRGGASASIDMMASYFTARAGEADRSRTADECRSIFAQAESDAAAIAGIPALESLGRAVAETLTRVLLSP